MAKAEEFERSKASAFFPRLGTHDRQRGGFGDKAAGPTGSLFPSLRKSGNLFPRENPTIQFFKEVGSRREQGQHPCTAQTLIAHPQPSCPGTLSQTPNFPPLLPPPSRAGKTRQLVQSKGSQNNERKSRVRYPISIHAAGKKVQLLPLAPEV